MERKIIEITKEYEDYGCIICGDDKGNLKLTINRLVTENSLTSFHVCDKCLARMQKDIEICE